MARRRGPRDAKPEAAELSDPINWKKVGAGVAAGCAGISAFIAGMSAAPAPSGIPRVSYIQVRSLEAFKVDAPHWRSWRARVTYRDEAGGVQRDVPITVDVEEP